MCFILQIVDAVNMILAKLACLIHFKAQVENLSISNFRKGYIQKNVFNILYDIQPLGAFMQLIQVFSFKGC